MYDYNQGWAYWHVNAVFLHLYMYIQTCKSENSSFKVFLVALLKESIHCKLQGTIVKTASISCLLSRTRNHCLSIRLPAKKKERNVLYSTRSMSGFIVSCIKKCFGAKPLALRYMYSTCISSGKAPKMKSWIVPGLKTTRRDSSCTTKYR